MGNPSPGDLRERVQVQRVTNTRDSMGGIIESWSTIATLYAMVEPMRAGEQFRRQQIQADADWKVSIRYRGDIHPADRLVWRTRTMQVVGMTNDDMRRRFSIIACKELQVSATVVSARYTPTYHYLGF